MAIIIFVIVKKLKVIKININISEYTGLLALLVYSNNFIIEKTVNGDTNLKILFFKSFIVSITIIILGWILSKIDKKEYTLEKKL